MPNLADMLTRADAQARSQGCATAHLSRGLTVIVDYRQPERQQIRFGRPIPAWPSSDEMSICRRHIDIPPGADVARYEQDGWNVIAYTWPTGAPESVCK